MLSMLSHSEVQSESAFPSITGTDYLEFYVGNARQSAYYYRAAFGMSLVAWAGPETGLRDRASYVVEQGEIRFVLTTPLRPDGGIADHIRRHGDGVRDIGFGVDDARRTWREATRRGARSVHECRELEDQYGRVKVASIATYGDTVHTFVERDKYFGPFLPGYEPVDHGAAFEDPIARPVGLTAIDHIAANVGWNERHRWIKFYTGVLGFALPARCKEETTQARPSAASQVVTYRDGRVSFPIDDPAEDRVRVGGQGKSPIEEYLQSYHGPGVQRIALGTDNIVETVGKMRRQGVGFVGAPPDHYEGLKTRMDCQPQTVEEWERLGIVLESDECGPFLQALTRPVEDRPTLSFAIVQRDGGFAALAARA